MYAIVDVAGQQFKVEKGQKIYVHRLSNKEGSVIDIDKVLLIDKGEKILVGDPVIKGANVTAKVLEHPRGDKVKVYKKKRRKGYEVLRGHRQDLTFIEIESINEKAAAKKAAPPAKETKPAAEAQVKETAAKTPAARKPAAKKPAASKATAAKAPAAKKTTAKPAASKSTATKKAEEKKAPAAKKPAAKKPAAKKPAAKKPAAKKTDKK